MSWFKRLPEIETCCCCIPDLRAATAIIAVIGIISSPAMSWTMVRHSYTIRVACYVTTSSDRVDVMDLTLNNIVSFGFGVNAGLGPSCMSYASNDKKTTTTVAALHRVKTDPSKSNFVKYIKYFGWTVLVADICFAVACISILCVIFKKPSYRHLTVFMVLAFISILLSCVYGLLYVGACVSLGGALPLFELFFSIFDMIVWAYFIMVVKTFRAVSFGVATV